MSMTPGDAGDPNDNSFMGYTFFPPGKNSPSLFSGDDMTDVVVNTSADDISATIHHELRHVLLGDFGRTGDNAKGLMGCRRWRSRPRTLRRKRSRTRRSSEMRTVSLLLVLLPCLCWSQLSPEANPAESQCQCPTPARRQRRYFGVESLRESKCVPIYSMSCR